MNKEILRLAIPNILANLSVPLLSVVDVALMGHLNGKSYLLAIGFGVMIFNFIYWGFGFLRMGVTGLTAQEVGRKNIDESYRILFRGLLIAFVGGVLLFVFKPYFLKITLYFIDANTSVNLSLTTYFNIRIYAAPATLGLYAFIGWFLGKQNATIPMIITILVNVVNAFLSYFLVTSLHLQIVGVAYGTVIAQYLGLLVAIIFFWLFYRKEITKNAYQQIFNLLAIKRFMSVNIDIIIRTLCLIFTIAFFKVMSVKYNDIIGSANILLLEFTSIAAYGIDGFAFAVETISGKYFGAKDKIKFKKAIRYCFYWGFIFGGLYSLAYLLFGNSILHMLSSQQDVVQLADKYLIWLVVFPILSVLPFIWDGVFIGVTASKAMRNTMLFATFIVFLPTFYILQYYFGNHGIWLSMMLFVVARGVSQTIIAKRVIWNNLWYS